MQPQPKVEATPEGASIGTNSATLIAKERILAGERLETLPPRTADPAEVDQIHQDQTRRRESAIKKYQRAWMRYGGGPAAVRRIVRQAATGIKRTCFDDPASMAVFDERLERIMAAGQPLYFALPLGGGKAPNEAKVGDHYLPDVTEWMAFTLLSDVAEAISRFYPPGAFVVIIPDAPLHTADLAFPFHEASIHVSQLQRDLVVLGINQHVHVVDTIDYLPDEWPDEVMDQASQARARAISDDEFAADLHQLTRSLMFSMNTRAFGWGFDRSLLVNAALGGSTQGLPKDVVEDAVAVYRRTKQVVPLYVGVNRALRTLDIPARVVLELSGSPDYLRWTAHQKPGEPRPMLTESNSRARPGLLPMHSLPLRFESKGRPRYASIFEVEARVYGYRSVLERDTGRFLFYEQAEEAVAAAQAAKAA